MRRTFIFAALFASNSILFAPISRGQEMQYLGARMDEQLEATKASARLVMERLLLQPKDVREAGLELSEHPELVIRLKHANTTDPLEIDRLLTSYPATVQTAARTMMTHRDLIDALGENLASTELLGRTYAREKEGIRSAMERLSLQRSEQVNAASNAWNARLSANSAARQQLDQAAGQTGQMVAGLPNGRIASFALENADRYPDLASEIVDQWEREKNSEDFRTAVDMWFATNRDVLPDDFIGDPATRSNLLKEHALFSRKIADLHRAEPTQMIDYQQVLLDNQKEFPLLVGVQQAKAFARVAAGQVQRVPGAPWVGGGRSSGGRSSSSSGNSSSRSGRSGTSSNRSSNNSSSNMTGMVTGNRNSRNGRNGGNNQNGDGGSSGFGGSRSNSRGNSGSGGSGSSGFGGGSGSGFGNSGSGGGSGFGSSGRNSGFGGGSGFGNSGSGSGSSGFGGGSGFGNSGSNSGSGSGRSSFGSGGSNSGSGSSRTSSRNNSSGN